MARVRIEIEYDDAEEGLDGPSGCWNAFGVAPESHGPSLLVTRDGERIVDLAWFKCEPGAPWKDVIVSVIQKAAQHVEEEFAEAEDAENEGGAQDGRRAWRGRRERSLEMAEDNWGRYAGHRTDWAKGVLAALLLGGWSQAKQAQFGSRCPWLVVWRNATFERREWVNAHRRNVAVARRERAARNFEVGMTVLTQAQDGMPSRSEERT